MSTRQSRRAEQRGHSGPGGPNKKDPMKVVYIGFAIAIAAVVVAFALFNVKQRHDAAAMYATPTPGPNAAMKPIQLVDQTTVGKSTLPPGDVAGGGSGSPVDGINCQPTEGVALHIHGHLAIFVNGKQIAVPKYIGLVPGAQGCLYWLHTHDSTGILHVEAPELANYTLGNFFHVWGAGLSRNTVASFTGPVTAFVNGAKYDGDLSAIPILAHQQITLEVGTPIVPPPNYRFPINE
ncbi:MAG: hypothetical protein M3126_07850 [Candidatus Eremiobacteraeota bacterium]|nr:hypothetical protein [Candidatus Eremiobacteraeota bacterium]